MINFFFAYRELNIFACVTAWGVWSWPISSPERSAAAAAARPQPGQRRGCTWVPSRQTHAEPWAHSHRACRDRRDQPRRATPAESTTVMQTQTAPSASSCSLLWLSRMKGCEWKIYKYACVYICKYVYIYIHVWTWKVPPAAWLTWSHNFGRFLKR